MRASEPHARAERGGGRTATAKAARRALSFAAGATFVLAPSLARADEPISVSEPRLMSETAEITSVADAFDNDDPFDVNLLLGFQQTWKSANIRRETALAQPGLSSGGYVAATENVAAYSQSTSTLNMGADIGLYKDVALILRLPLILSDSRSLDDLNGSSANQATRLAEPGPGGQQLFHLPFKSPTRSGVDAFSVGIDWAIFNQQRDWTKPTWVIGVSGRFSVGAPLHACNAGNPTYQTPGMTAPATAPGCPDPAFLGADGKSPNAGLTSPRDPGISRGTDAIDVHTMFSRRFGYVEPYTGFRALVEFAQYGDMANTNGFQGALLNHPPLVGTFFLGMEVIPWERREQFQRLVGNLQIAGSYHSAGRDYSELFDALGSSMAPSLRSANPSTYHGGTFNGKPSSVGCLPGDTDTACAGSSQVYFTGITDTAAYGSLALNGSATWQAGEYIKFVAGLGATFNQSHLITAADSCNPSFSGGDVNSAGPCKAASSGTSSVGAVTGQPNPNHRDVIDLPGHRFTADQTTIVDLFVQGVVMF
jgi:hypothetical protein